MRTKQTRSEMGMGQKPMGGRLGLAGVVVAGLMTVAGVCAGAQPPAPAAAAPSTQSAVTGQSASATPASPTDIVGTWQGTLHIPKTDQHPQIDLRLVFKISKTMPVP